MEPLRRKVSVRLRLSLFALTVPLALAGLLLIWQDYDARRDAIITQVELKSAQINAQLEDFVHRIDGATGVFAASWVNNHGPNPANPAEAAVMNSYLSRLAEERPEFSAASITDTHGVVRAASDSSIVGARIGTDALFERARATTRLTASDVFVPDTEGAAPHALFVQPLVWDSGPTQAFLVTQSNLSTISGALDMSVGFPETAKSGIFDSSGKILAGTGYEAPHPGLAAGRDISKSAVWAHAATRPTREWFGPGLDKVQRIIFFSYPDSTPWVSTVAYAQSELFDPLWNRLWTFAGVLGLTVIATMWVGDTLIRRERRSIESLEKERVTLDAVMNGATDGIMVIDNHDSVNFANRSLEELIGMAAGSLAQMSVQDARTAIAGLSDDPDDTEAQLEDATEVGTQVQVFNLDMRDKIGLEFEMTSYPVIAEGGALLGRTLVFHDISKDKAVSRMKSQFLMTASHQLRTPMASILTFAELSISREVSPPKQREWLTLIQEQATRMVSTINSILNVSQIESGRLELTIKDVDAGGVCRSVVREFEGRSPNHRFTVNVPVGTARVRADSARLEQIVENLVDNAVKYTPGDGTIGITVDVAAHDMVHFRVSDTGIGIPAEAQRRLFIPFFRVSDEQTSEVSGSGLGLYIARNLVEHHGGEMWLESEPGTGTTAHFTLPATATASAPLPAGTVQHPGVTAPAVSPSMLTNRSGLPLE